MPPLRHRRPIPATGMLRRITPWNRISLSGPRLLHRRTRHLTPRRCTATGSTTLSDDTTEDEEEKETADAGADADDEGFVVVDPGTDFFEGRGVFALALGVGAC